MRVELKSTHQTILGDPSSLHVMLPQRSQCLYTTTSAPCRATAYLRDTIHFLTRLEGLGTLLPGTLLVTLDVKFLYTNIPHTDGIEACRAALNTRAYLYSLPVEDLIELIRLVLTKNIFTCAGQHYLQSHGTDMGTHAASSYANIFIGRLESQILAETEKKPHIWWRYDVFTI